MLKIYILVFTLIATSLTAQKNQKDESSFKLSTGLEYAHIQYGQLHGVSIPFSLEYSINKSKIKWIGIGFRISYGESNYNYSGDEDRLYNIDINRQVPPYAFFSGSTFFSSYGLKELRGVTGHGLNFYYTAHAGNRFNLLNRSLDINLGIYLVQSTTSFVAGFAENILYEPTFAPGEVFNTDFLFPVWVKYLDIGPFVNLKYELFPNWRLPGGISASYHHGFYNNSTVHFGLYFDMKG